MRILIVDDSLSFRSQIKRALDDSKIEIVGSASNGRVAIDLLKEDRNIDLVILDMNMPVMNGIETIKEIKRLNLSPKIIVFASKTDSSVKETLEALNLGADDFIVKPEAKNVSFDQAHLSIQVELLPKVLLLGGKNKAFKTSEESNNCKSIVSETKLSPIAEKHERIQLNFFQPEIVVIASSTGGPRALEGLIASLINRPPKVPILIAQHMPANFTKHLADRLQNNVGFTVKEAEHNESLKMGQIYVCPGDYHMTVESSNLGNRIRLNQGERRKNVRPCAEFLFESVVRLYGATTMGFVLTGMGDDGVDGCRLIKEAGGGVMIQDKETSTVWGMPGAVAEKGFYDEIGSLTDCSKMLAHLVL